MASVSRRQLSRRDVLRLAAVGAAATVTGCTTEREHPATPTRPPSPSSSTAAGGPNWDALQARLTGRLVRPGQSDYRRSRELFNPRFDDIRPQAVAYCDSADDVRAAVTFARESNVALAMRAGGHSYGGWSIGSGLVLDVSRLAAARVSGRRRRSGPAHG